MWSYLEIIPHPETRIEPLQLEDFIAALYGTRATWAYIIVYDGGHLGFYYIVPRQLTNSTVKSLESRFNKIIIEESKPPRLIDYKYYTELRLLKSFYYPLFHLTRQKEIESNPVDVIASSMLGGESMVLIIATPEPRGAGVIAGFVYEKKTGKPASTGKIILKEALSLGDAFFGSTSSTTSKQQYVYKPELTEEEKRILREAQYKMHHQLYATRIIVLAKEEDLVYDIASSFNQFPLNGFTFKVKEVNEKILREIKELKPRRLGLLFKDKKIPVLSPRELAAYVNLPTALDTLPVKTASIILNPPPEIPEEAD